MSRIKVTRHNPEGIPESVKESKGLVTSILIHVTW